MGKGREGAIKDFACRPIVWNADAQRVGGELPRPVEMPSLARVPGNAAKLKH